MSSGRIGDVIYITVRIKTRFKCDLGFLIPTFFLSIFVCLFVCLFFVYSHEMIDTNEMNESEMLLGGSFECNFSVKCSVQIGRN